MDGMSPFLTGFWAIWGYVAMNETANPSLMSGFIAKMLLKEQKNREGKTQDFQ